MKAKYILPAVFASLLIGCGTVSQVSKEGDTVEPVFPELTQLTMQNGSWPNPDSLGLLQAGMTRDQVYSLIGHPHFKEGIETPEWDYLLNLRTVEGHKACQLKVIFDKDKIAQNFYWLPEGCMDLQEPVPLSFTLDGDVSFGFDSAQLTASGRKEVSKLAQNLNEQGVLKEVVVAGHTDRIGSDAYNNDLSQRRAEAVRRALTAEGIDSAVIHAVGHGKSQPVVECENTNRTDLVSCLAPNRRVEITAQGTVTSE